MSAAVCGPWPGSATNELVAAASAAGLVGEVADRVLDHLAPGHH